jgi:DNA modification methylase
LPEKEHSELLMLFILDRITKGHTPETIFDEIKPILDECSRALSPGGVLAINLMDIQNMPKGRGKNKYHEWLYTGVKYQQYLRTLGFQLRDVVQWWKKNHNWAHSSHLFPVDKVPHTEYRFSQETEQVLIFRKEGVRVELPSEEVQINSHLTEEQFKAYGKNVWEINFIRKDHGHPCVFPEELCERVIRMFSFEGDTVLDPFLGSGTTVKVARDLGRIGIGYERELKYKPVIMEKLGIKPVEVTEKAASGKIMGFVEEQLKNTFAEGMSEADVEYQGYTPDLPSQPALSADSLSL